MQPQCQLRCSTKQWVFCWGTTEAQSHGLNLSVSVSESWNNLNTMTAPCQCSNSVVYIKKPRRKQKKKQQKKKAVVHSVCLSSRHLFFQTSLRRLVPEPHQQQWSFMIWPWGKKHALCVRENLLRVRGLQQLQAISCLKGMQHINPGGHSESRASAAQSTQTKRAFYTNRVCVWLHTTASDHSSVHSHLH